MPLLLVLQLVLSGAVPRYSSCCVYSSSPSFKKILGVGSFCGSQSMLYCADQRDLEKRGSVCTVCPEELIAARCTLRAVSFPPPKNTKEVLRNKMWLIWMQMTTILSRPENEHLFAPLWCSIQAFASSADILRVPMLFVRDDLC